ncbi:MAG: tetratricopeptide repeat protein, partial [Candidatus Marisimplicoccus sp.]
WDNLKEDEYEGPIPNVKFSKSLQTIRLQPDEVQTNEPEFDPISNDEEAKEQEGFFNDSIDDEIDYGEVDTSNSGGGIPRWLYYLMLVLAIFLLFRVCQFGGSRDGSYYYDRGVTHFESGDDKRALRDFDRAIDIDDSYTDPYIKRVEIYIKQGNYYEAIYDLDDIILEDSTNWYAYYLRGKAYMKRAESLNGSKYSPDYQKALDDFTSSINLNSLQDNAMSFLLRGKVYLITEPDFACDNFYIACDYGVDEACTLVEEECYYPETGFMPYAEKFGSGLYGGNNSYEFDNSLGDTDVIVTLKRLENNFRVRSVFIRKGDDYIMERIPNGRYIIQWYEGNDWITSKVMSDGITRGGFLKDEDFTAGEESRSLFNNIQRTLQFNAVDGNFNTKRISEDDFLN